VLARFVSPLDRYQRIVSDELEPGFIDDEIAVLGVNTARAFTFKGGRVSPAQVEQLRRALSSLDGERTKILVAHHSCKALEECGVDVVVSGHRHATRVSARRLPKNSYLMIEAGTATSHRTREEPNAFNLLCIRPGKIAIQHYALRSGNFLRAGGASFSRDTLGWRRDAGQ